VSILTAREIAEPTHQSSMVTGIDRGVVNLATLSDGSVFEIFVRIFDINGDRISTKQSAP